MNIPNTAMKAHKMAVSVVQAMETHIYLTTIMESPALAEKSKTQYRRKLLDLVEMMNHDYDWIIDHPERVLEAIYDTHGENQTRKAFIAAVKALFKYNDSIRGDHPGMFDRWDKASKEVNERINERRINHTMTEKERANWVTWAEIMAKESELATTSNGSRDHLVLAMYCLAEAPVRQDFGAMRIMREEPVDPKEGNYLVLSPAGSRMVLNEYKTAKALGQLTQRLPEKLVRVIEASLTRTPRAYLFLNANGVPFTDGAYTKMVSRTLKEIFGKDVTLNMIRHSYTNEQDFNETRAVFRNARKMGHSVTEHMLYKKALE
jgi:hypothetical protein